MKNPVLKNFFREVRGSLGRFISILFIVTLGVAFFAGVRACEPDMRETMDTYIRAHDYMDLRVLSTLGLTDGDLEALSEVEGVTRLEAGYSVDVLSDLGGETLVIEAMSIPETMNTMEVYEGALPQADDECLLDRQMAEDLGLAVGDTITVYAGGEEDLADSLAYDTYTVTGIGSYPGYLTNSRGSASIGDGSVDGFIALPASAFTQEAYTVIYMRADGLSGYDTYDGAYEAAVDAIKEEAESLETERCEIRLAELYEEIEDGEAEIADGWEEIADGQSEIADAKAELADAEEELEDAEAELADGEAELAQQKADTYAELADAQAEIDDGLSQLEDGFDAYYENKETLEASEQTLAESKEELDAAREELDAAWEEVEAAEEELAAAKTQIDALAEQAEQLEAALSLAATEELTATYETLKAQLESAQAEYASGLAQIAATKETLNESEEAYSEGLAQYKAGKKELEAGKKELAAGFKTLLENQQTLEDAQAELDAGRAEADAQFADAEEELADAQEEIDNGRTEIEDGRTEIEDAEEELADAKEELYDAEEEIADGRAELEELGTGEWYVLDRGENEDYAEYDADASKIGAIGQVFPLLFFLVAALVSLTGMTRMVEEQRGQIGTFSALGYGKRTIIGKYVAYCLLATVAGSVLGVFVGEKLLPYIIITSYGDAYVNLNVVAVPIVVRPAIAGLAAAVGCNLAATLLACANLLRSAPAGLMRPTAPHAGTKIFLEYFVFFWKRLSFSMKAALRNLFRYKKRLCLTVIGIGGCTMLMVVGFGIGDSIEAVTEEQYGVIWTYDASCSVDEDASEAELKELEDYLESESGIGGVLDLMSESMDVCAEDEAVTKSVTLLIPESTEAMEDYIHLTDPDTGEALTLSDGTVIVTEKLAEVLDVAAGDSILFDDGEGTQYTAVVGGVAKNYMLNYIYMTPDTYEQMTGLSYTVNYKYLQYADGADGDALASVVMEQEAVIGFTKTTDSLSQLDYFMNSLALIIGVLTAAAGILAFIVIFNLNNISITERRRELATLKVLGFYDGEVAMYVYRENIFLTAFGIVCGLILGNYMHHYVMHTVEMDTLIFGMQVSVQSFAISAVLTAVFAFLVNALTFFTLRRIDMIESLKSVE